MDLHGLNSEEFSKLILSVGTHRGKRPLSPIEISNAFRKMLENGATLATCARSVHLEGTEMVTRFLKLQDLDSELHHLVSWGDADGKLSFSIAQQLAQLEPAEQHGIAKSVLLNKLSSKEVIQVLQLVRRSGRKPKECLNEIVGMRPETEIRSVVVGSVSELSKTKLLKGMSQAQRDVVLRNALEELMGCEVQFSGSLSPVRFTITGDQSFHNAFKHLGEDFEETITAALKV